MSDKLSDLQQRITAFSAARDWDQFHTPKNLTLALMGEVGELAAELQWLTDEQVTEALAADHSRDRIGAEMADVLIYLLMLADRSDIDLVDAAVRKIEKNEIRYPRDRARGSAAKYTDLT